MDCMKRVLLIYQFFHPDTVVSARLFSDLAEDLQKAGMLISVFTCNRLIRSDEQLAAKEDWNGIRILRFSRPGFAQGSNVGRLINSAILQLKWIWAFFRMRKEFDAVIVGTDPQFCYFMFPFFRLANRKVTICHWVFDLYPEAILVNSPKWMKMAASLIKPILPFVYRQVDIMADIGCCMRARVKRYGHKALCETLTPWALVEPTEIPPACAEMRKELFGDAKIGLLYSGTVGYAHDLTDFIKLARICREKKIDAAFCFAGYGNRYNELVKAITSEDTNIRLAGFASEKDLERRLSAADIHLISLRPGWEGIVVPSKFFGALAIGRGVLFSGAPGGEIPQWIKQHRIGELLNEDTPEWLEKMIRNPELISEMQKNAFDVYRTHFSREIVSRRWQELLQQ